MFEKLKAWFRRAFVSARTRLVTWFRRKKPARGRWETGEHREASGLLAFAPFVTPHRAYRLYFPHRYQAAERLPLLVMLHGCKQDPDSFSSGTRINDLADRQRFLVLYPEQRRLANLGRCWNWFDPSSHSGDGEAAIIAGMVRAVAARYHADGSRIYVAGISAGGAMASALASCYADLFAACAVHSGLMFQAAGSPATALPTMRHGSDYDPKQAGKRAFEMSGNKVDAMPMMVIHGDQDTTVNPVNAEQIIVQFSTLNQLCAAAKKQHFDATKKNTTFHATNGQYRYEIHDYGDAERPLIRQITIAGLGHAWSGGDQHYEYNDPRGPNASEMMWAFFQQHRRVSAVNSVPVNQREA
ncbi:MAG: PHB depolymerase family esterase [Burkholderiales bacterium]